MKKILFISFILFIGFISAMDIDNKLGYSDNDMKVSFDNVFGLGKHLGDIELKSHSSIDEIRHIDLEAGHNGEEKVVMWYDFDFLEIYENGLGDVKFINMDSGKEENKPYKFVYAIYDDVEVNDYEVVCNPICDDVKSGSHIENKIVDWKELKDKNIPKGKITIGLMTSVNFDDYYDSIWTITGKEVSRHAQWDILRSVSLTGYCANDMKGIAFNKSNLFVVCEDIDKILTLDMNGVYIKDYANVGGTGSVGAGANETSLWYMKSDNTIYEVSTSTGAEIRHFSGSGSCASSPNGVTYISPYLYVVELNTDSVCKYTVSGSYLGKWSMHVTHDLASQPGNNGTDLYIGEISENQIYEYKPDGTYITDKTSLTSLTRASGFTTNCSITPTDEICTYFVLDEDYGIRMYEGVYGTYVPPNPITVNLNTPTDSTTTNNITIDFNCSATASTGNIQNVSLFIDGDLNYTETGSASYLELNQPLNFQDGSYEWTCRAYDDSNNLKWADSNFTFTVNTTPAISFITPPTPVNYANWSLSYLPISVDVETNYFKNITYFLQNVNGTSFTQSYSTPTYDINFTGITTAHYHYNVTVCTTTNQCNSTETRHLNHDVNPPIINITDLGTITYQVKGDNLAVNWTITDDNDLGTCKLEYAGSNSTIPCSNNGTYINTTSYDYRDVVLWVNDSFGNSDYSTMSWNYKIFELNKTFNSETTEGSFEDFILYLKKGSGINIQGITINYDGEESSTSVFSSGNNVHADSELFIEDVPADTNQTFYYTITLDDSTVFNTTSATQLVRSINLDDCSIQPNLFLTLNLLDEGNQDYINGTIEIYLNIVNPTNFGTAISFNDSYVGVTNKTFCSDILLNESGFLLNAQIRYDSENHSAEFYNLQRSDLSLYPKIYNLYDLKDEDTTRFKILYRGQNLIGVEGAIVQLQRKYISEGIYKIVEAPLTSSTSTAIVHIDTDTNLYKATVVKDGQLLNVFDNLNFICQSELTGECTLDLLDYIVPPNSISIDTLQDFSYTITSSIEDKTITIDYSIPSGTTSLVRVTAVQTDIVGEETICNTTVSSAGGSIECEYDDTIQDSYIDYLVYKDNLEDPIVQKSYIVKDDLRDEFSGDNYFILIIFAISLIFMALSSPEWIVINAIISILVGGATWLLRGMDFVLGLGAIAWLILGAVILIIKMSKQEDQ